MNRKQLPHLVSLVLLAALLGAGCDATPTAPESAAQDVWSSSLGRANGAVTVPFNARFFTELAGLLPDESCGSPPVFLNIQQG